MPMHVPIPLNHVIRVIIIIRETKSEWVMAFADNDTYFLEEWCTKNGLPSLDAL